VRPCQRNEITGSISKRRNKKAPFLLGRVLKAPENWEVSRLPPTIPGVLLLRGAGTEWADHAHGGSCLWPDAGTVARRSRRCDGVGELYSAGS